MRTTIRIGLCLVVIAVCFVTSCGQVPPDKRIDEINAAKRKARKLVDEAEQKRAEARKEDESGDQVKHNKLIEEAAELYKQASDALNEAADKSDEMAKLKTPEWYEEYFSLQTKLIRNLATMGASAHDELLIRKNGPPSESLVQSWKKDLARIGKENEEFRRRITAIESRERIVLIKE